MNASCSDEKSLILYYLVVCTPGRKPLERFGNGEHRGATHSLARKNGLLLGYEGPHFFPLTDSSQDTDIKNGFILIFLSLSQLSFIRERERKEHFRMLFF